MSKPNFESYSDRVLDGQIAGHEQELEKEKDENKKQDIKDHLDSLKEEKTKRENK